MRIALSGLFVFACGVLAGCGGVSSTAVLSSTAQVDVGELNGHVHGGQQPVAGAHVYLMAAGTTGYGAASTSLIATGAAGTDSVGKYVLTDANGNFSVTGDYGCTAGTQVYLYALGGNPGAGANSAAGLMAALGQCPATGTLAAQVPVVMVNEISTVVAAYAMAGFATDATHVSSSGTTLAQLGIANAFANVSNLMVVSSGQVRSTTPAGNGTVPVATINTLADILAACINSTGPASGSCVALFANAKSGGVTGTAATDTATAAINLAHNPGSVGAYSLALGTPPFQPTLASAPTDFTISVTYGGGGMVQPQSIAVDAAGDVWIASTYSSSVVKMSPLGAVLSGSSGYSANVLGGPTSIAIDTSGNAWVNSYNYSTYEVVEFSNSGSVLSGANGFTGGGLNGTAGMAIDAAGNVWEGTTGALSEFSNSGTALSGTGGFTGGGVGTGYGTAIDGTGNVWMTNSTASNSISKFTNTGVAVSGTNGYTGGGLSDPLGIAVDAGGNVWVTNQSNTLGKFSNAGVALSGTGYTGGGLGFTLGVAIDGANNVWTANGGQDSLGEFTNAGVALSGTFGFNPEMTGTPYGVAVDGSGNVWVVNGAQVGFVTEFLGAGAPVTTPLAAAVKANALGVRP